MPVRLPPSPKMHKKGENKTYRLIMHTTSFFFKFIYSSCKEIRLSVIVQYPVLSTCTIQPRSPSPGLPVVGTSSSSPVQKPGVNHWEEQPGFSLSPHLIPTARWLKGLDTYTAENPF